MSVNHETPSTRRKVWYGIAIFLSCLVILISATGIIGSWIVGNALSTAAVQLLIVVEDTATGVRNIVARLDQDLRQVQEISSEIMSASDRISQNVTDKGLVLTLLPEEREQALVERASDLIETLTTVRNSVAAGIELYRTIDSLPFVSLPAPSQDSISNLEKSAGEIRSAAQDLAAGVSEFRSGVTARIDRVTQLAERVTSRLDETRARLSELDGNLASLQETSERLQGRVPFVFGLASFLLTLLFAYVLYTQIEVIRLFAARWRGVPAVAVIEEPPVVPPPVPSELDETPAPEPAVEELEPALPKSLEEPSTPEPGADQASLPESGGFPDLEENPAPGEPEEPLSS